jgi:gamma-glutamyltranspeptidase/glutathione hydrolase
MAEPAAPHPKTLRAPAICVAPDRLAAEAGAEMMKRGGNAFDAAVAAGFAEAVVSPYNCGIGGYAAVGAGFHAATGRAVALDANAVAPAAAAPGMFPVVPAREPGGFRFPDDRHRHGPLSVAVPGVLGGLRTMLEAWGTLDRKAVMAPAIRLCREGVPLNAIQGHTWRTIEARAEGLPRPEIGDPPKLIPMPRLADTLEAIADEGADVFYSGRIGRAITAHVQKLGGLLTTEDMAAYRAQVVEPLSIQVRGYTLSTPPPAAGGLTSLQIIALFDRLDRRGKAGPTGDPWAFEAFLESMKVAWEERLTRLGDPNAMNVAPRDLLTDRHLDELLERVLDGLAHPGPGRLIAPDPLRGTVHLAAADASWNVVSWTQTHGGGFGSMVMVPGTGVVLGHAMTRFDPRPGWVNSIAPGKAPLHNMAPVVATIGGRPALAVGASGGRTIVNNVAAVLIHRLIHGLDPGAAVAAPRFQCETVEPATIESAAGAACLAALRARGHALNEAPRDAGLVHLIAREREAWVGVPEPRAADTAAAGVNGD